MPGWSDTESANARSKKVYLKDEVTLAEFDDPDEYKQFRLVGPITSYAWSWQQYKNEKDPKGKPHKFPKLSLDYNPQTGKFDKEIDPYRKAGLYFPQRFISNAFDRELQNNPPKKQRPHTKYEKKSRKLFGDGSFHLKEKGSKSWTPAVVLDVPVGVKDQIVSLTDLWHKRRLAAAKKKAGGKDVKLARVELSDPKYGCDILIKFNREAKGPKQWDVQLAERTPLTEEEQEFLLHDIEHLESLKPETQEEAEKEWKRLKKLIILKDKDGKIIKPKDDDDDEDEDEDFEEDTPKKKKKLKSGKSSKLKDKVKKKKKLKSGKSSDDDVPFKKSKKIKSSKIQSSKAKLKKNKKKADEFDDFGDLDD